MTSFATLSDRVHTNVEPHLPPAQGEVHRQLPWVLRATDRLDGCLRARGRLMRRHLSGGPGPDLFDEVGAVEYDPEEGPGVGAVAFIGVRAGRARREGDRVGPLIDVERFRRQPGEDLRRVGDRGAATVFDPDVEYGLDRVHGPAV